MKRRERRTRERSAEKRNAADAPRVPTAALLVRGGVAGVLGLLLYLSQPYFSMQFRALPAIGPFLPVVLLPAIVGAFVGLSVPGLLPRAALGVLVPLAGGFLAMFLLPEGVPAAVPAGAVAIQAAIGAAAALAAGFLGEKIGVRRAAVIVLALLLLNFALLVDHGDDRVYYGSATEPPAESYSFDGTFFLKLFYLVGHGQDYYGAWDAAFRGDARFDRPYSEIWTWRMPTLYWIWSAVASRGDTLVIYFILLSLTSMVCIYLAAAKHSDPVLGLWSAGFLGSYLYFGAITFWYAITDYWSFFLALPAATLYLYGRRNIALPIALLAGLIREWSALLLVAAFLDNLLSRRWREAAVWGAACALVGGAYLAHWRHVAEYMRHAGIPVIASRGESAAGRGGGISFLLYTVPYAWRFLAGGPVIPYLVFAAGLFGSATAWVRSKDPFPLLAVLVVFAGFMVYGTGAAPGDPPGSGDQYNIHYMPYLIMSVPFALRLAVDRPRAA